MWVVEVNTSCINRREKPKTQEFAQQFKMPQKQGRKVKGKLEPKNNQVV